MRRLFILRGFLNVQTTHSRLKKWKMLIFSALILTACKGGSVTSSASASPAIAAAAPLSSLATTGSSSNASFNLINLDAQSSTSALGSDYWLGRGGANGGTDLAINGGNGLTTGGVEFDINNSTLMFLNAYGQVGIGTRSPNNLLDLKTPPGTAAGSTSLYGINLTRQDNTANPSGIFHGVDSNPSSFYWENTILSAGAGGGSSLVFMTNKYAAGLTETMRLTRDGALGVNMAAPRNAIDILGNNSTHSGSASVEVVGYRSSFTVMNAAGNQNWYFGVDDANGNNLLIGQGYSAQQNNSTFGARMVFANNGNVGIGTTSPQFLLDVNGTARVSGNLTTSSLTYSSDRRLKTDLQPLELSLEHLITLKPISYTWNALAEKRGLLDKSRQIGLIAQDVEILFPELVKTDSDGYKSVNYPALVAPVIQAIQEFYAKWVSKSNEQDQKISELQSENKDLKKRLEKLEASFAQTSRPQK